MPLTKFSGNNANVVKVPAKKDGGKFKIWTATRDSKNGFMVTPTTSIMAGSKKNFVAADSGGVYLSGGGSISFNTTSENIRMGGLFVQLNDFIRMIPSTIMTPFPPVIPFPPLSLPIMIATSLPWFIALYVI